MKQKLFRLASAVMVTSTVLVSCKKDMKNDVLRTSETSTLSNEAKVQKWNTFKGPQVHIGNGKMRSFVIISHDGVPKEIGIEMTPNSLQGLPTSGHEETYEIPFHQKVHDVTPYDHLQIGWNPFGHPPPGIYSLPHFDIHFYTISHEEQMAIPAYTPQTAALFDNFPPEGYLPAGYIPFPEGVPQMGKHWGDVTSPEFNGQTFTKTFLYGTYNGEVTFYEPMVTKAFLESITSSSSVIKQPSIYSPTNTYYPTMYNVYKDNSTGNIYISLSGFVWR